MQTQGHSGFLCGISCASLHLVTVLMIRSADAGHASSCGCWPRAPRCCLRSRPVSSPALRPTSAAQPESVFAPRCCAANRPDNDRPNCPASGSAGSSADDATSYPQGDAAGGGENRVRSDSGSSVLSRVRSRSPNRAASHSDHRRQNRLRNPLGGNPADNPPNRPRGDPPCHLQGDFNCF